MVATPFTLLLDDAGASLVQVYTGLIYEGPGVPRAIVSGLLDRLRSAGLKEIKDTIGRV